MVGEPMRTPGARVRFGPAGLVLLALLILGLGRPLVAESPPDGVRIALLSQWTVIQHRGGARLGGRPALLPAFRQALDTGVTDRVVFAWQRGVIPRSALVSKPIRVLSGPEAAGLGGRGEFELVGLRTPQGAAAWTTLEVVARTGQAQDVLVLELGGELNTAHQVLETLLVLPPAGELEELALARRALILGEGVPVFARPFGQPVAFSGPPPYFVAGGLGFLVVRSQVEAITDGGTTPNGPADLARPGAGEWREGDRVFIRVPLTTLRDGVPAVVLGWKDRTYRDGPDPDIFFRRLSLGALPIP